MKRVSLLLLTTASLCSLPATAESILFSDLGPAGSAYDALDAFSVDGSASFGTSFSWADQFTVAGSGSEAVSEIDLAVSVPTGDLFPATFQASIWSDDSGVLGTQVSGASWSTSSTVAPAGSCCTFVSITDISGVTLTGGAQYFMVLEPLSATDNSFNGWAWNNQGIFGDEQYSNNGGVTWVDIGSGNQALGAFDVLSGTTANTPEPSTVALLGTGIVLLRFRKMRNCRAGVLRL